MARSPKKNTVGRSIKFYWLRFMRKCALFFQSIAIFFSFIKPFEYPALAGLIGFLYAIAVLMFDDWKNESFNTVRLVNQRDTLLAHFNNKEDSLNVLSKKLAKDSTNKPDDIKSKIRDSLNRISGEVSKVQIIVFELTNGNADTAADYYSRFYKIDRNNLSVAISSVTDTVPVTVFIIDSSWALWGGVHMEKHRINVLIENGTNRIDFYRNNDRFAFWLVLSLIQSAAWFLIASLIFGRSQQLEGNSTKKSLWASFFTPVLCIAAFVFVFYKILLGTPVINQGTFLHQFHSKMAWYAVPGYISAVICFGVYLFSAKELDELEDYVKNKLQSNITADPTKVQRASDLSNLFDGAFLCTAIILSVFVLWLGVMFNAINGMEAYRFFQKVSGTPYLNNNFVYLVGMMHSLLLLLFYIPVRLKFNSLGVTAGTKGVQVSGNKLINSLLGSLGTLFVTASPIITGVIQQILSSFIEK